MKADGKHIAARFGDHANAGLRDVAPGKMPFTMFHEDGSVWMVIDLDERIARAVRRLARQERVRPDVLLSQIIVEGLTKFADELERGF